MRYSPYLAKIRDYTFLLNARNSNSNCRFRFGSNIKGIRFYATPLPDLPKVNSPNPKSFYLVFEFMDIFDMESFKQEVLKHVDSETWYFIVAYIHSDSKYKRLESNHYVYSSSHFSLEDNTKVDILHRWLISKQMEFLKE